MQDDIVLHTKENFEEMRKAGSLACRVLDFIEQYVDVGISTLELNDLCHDFIVSNGAIPAPLNYNGFPKSICTSVNHIVCHGIPSSSQKLSDGDIVNIDVIVILNGWHGDTSRTYKVGSLFQKNSGQTTVASRLVDAAYNAMMIGIEKVKPGIRLYDVGGAIQEYVEKEGFSVVRDYCGHGIGRKFHASPSILHYKPLRESGFVDCVLKPGMFFTIEPMINAGKKETITSRADNWTVTTRDKSLSAQFEHTIGVNDNGYEIFTINP